MSSEKKCPETPPKPKDGESQKLVEHLRSAHKSKEAMIETHFENQILQAYFNDELLGMKSFEIVKTFLFLVKNLSNYNKEDFHITIFYCL